MTFVYIKGEEFWVLLQAWEGEFSLNDWCSCDLKNIARKTKEKISSPLKKLQ
jgi:hypothetical protein